jgi:hypothetical protein
MLRKIIPLVDHPHIFFNGYIFLFAFYGGGGGVVVVVDVYGMKLINR